MVIIIWSAFGKPALINAESGGFDQIWQEFYISTTLSKNISAGLLFNTLYNSELRNYDRFIEGSFKYQLKEWLRLEALYRYENYVDSEIWTYEKRPSVRFVMQKNIEKWSFTYRNRFEMRYFEKYDSEFRYRTDFKVMPEINLTSWQLNPYLLEEVFVGKGEFSRVRSYLGIQGKKKWFEPGIYLLVQSDKNSRSWTNALIGGIVLGVKF